MKNITIKANFIPLALASTLTLSTFSITGCVKKMDCDIKDEHLHKYISEEGFETYIDSEYEIKNNMSWTKEIASPNKELKVMDEFHLIKIEDNLEALEGSMKTDLPYIEYEYKFTTYRSQKIGKTTIRYPVSHYRYTEDPEDSRLTGYIRDVDYKYKGYRIGESKKGKTILIESELVDDLSNIKTEYPYFKLEDYKQKVYSEQYKKEKTKVK